MKNNGDNKGNAYVLVAAIFFVATSVSMLAMSHSDNIDHFARLCDMIKKHGEDIESGVSPFDARGFPAPSAAIKEACREREQINER